VESFRSHCSPEGKLTLMKTARKNGMEFKMTWRITGVVPRTSEYGGKKLGLVRYVLVEVCRPTVLWTHRMKAMPQEFICAPHFTNLHECRSKCFGKLGPAAVTSGPIAVVLVCAMVTFSSPPLFLGSRSSGA
jgi:hypothetical protein